MKKIYEIFCLVIYSVLLGIYYLLPYIGIVIIIFIIGECTSGNETEKSVVQKKSQIERREELSRIGDEETQQNRVEQINPIDEQYLSNSLNTGATPYKNKRLKGQTSKVKVTTSSGTDCDIVVIIKHNDEIVRNAYIKAGDSYTLAIPNGTFQVFFYGGRGWNPNKEMPNGYTGGFVADESFSKDDPIRINNQILEYELRLQRNGNFTTRPSNRGEIF